MVQMSWFTLNETLKEYAALVSLTTFVLGLLVGHKFALNRDRRKEYNEAAIPILEVLERQCLGLRASPPQVTDPDIKIAPFRRQLSMRRKKCLTYCSISIELPCKEAVDMKMGEYVVGDVASLIDANQKLQRFCTLK